MHPAIDVACRPWFSCISDWDKSSKKRYVNDIPPVELPIYPHCICDNIICIFIVVKTHARLQLDNFSRACITSPTMEVSNVEKTNLMRGDKVLISKFQRYHSLDLGSAKLENHDMPAC